MKMDVRQFLALSVLLVLSVSAYTQSWQCIHDGFVSYYYSPEAYHKTWTVKIDSTATTNGYKYYYGPKSARVIFSWYDEISHNSYLCSDPESASMIGSAMSAGEAGNFFFNSKGDAIRICTDRPVNQPWICCRINDSTHLEAVVSSVGIEQVLGVDDSVKYISFQAKRNSGDTLGHGMNDKIFKLSKSYGMLTLYDFYTFPGISWYEPYMLAGFKSPSLVKGIQNLRVREIFTFAPGDEFHTYYEPVHMEGTTCDVEQRIRIILDSTWNGRGDSVCYSVGRFVNQWTLGSDNHTYYRDTIKEVYNFSTVWNVLLDAEPGITVKVDNSNPLNVKFRYNDQEPDTDFGSKRTKYLQANFYHGYGCGDTLLDGHMSYKSDSYYIEDCGGPYYSIWNELDPIHNEVGYDLLKYYRKGNGTWGIPFDTTSWHQPNSENCISAGHPIMVFPNPARDLIHVKHINPGESLHLRIITLTGSVVTELDSDQQEIAIKLDTGWKGVYFLEITTEKNKRYVDKLVIL